MAARGSVPERVCLPLPRVGLPGQVLTVALQGMPALKTAHDDYTRTVAYHLPVHYAWPPATLGLPPPRPVAR